MSYCRWSCDDYRCDLYCYEDVDGGYTTHVASRRRRYLAPLPEPVTVMDGSSAARWLRRYNEVKAVPYEWEQCPKTADGADRYNDPDLPSFLARLEALRAQGFRFPDYAIDAVRQEIAEAAS